MCPLIVALSYGRRVGGYELGLGAGMPWGRLAGELHHRGVPVRRVRSAWGGGRRPLRRPSTDGRTRLELEPIQPRPLDLGFMAPIGSGDG
jgi:hypothetical protein